MDDLNAPLTNDEEEGIRNAFESLRRGEGIPYEDVKAELERLLKSEVTPPSSK